MTMDDRDTPKPDRHEKDDAFREELAGLAAGRMDRFLPEDHDSKPRARERKADKARRRTSALEMLLASASYRALHSQVFDTLRMAEQVTEAALVAVQTLMEKETGELADMREHANVLPDGRKVYRNAAGEAFTEDGVEIEGPILDGVVWRDGAPTYEEILAKRGSIAALQARIDALLLYQTDVLGTARNRLQDEDNPPSAEELNRLQRMIVESAPPEVSRRMSTIPVAGAGDIAQPSSAIGKPIL